MRLECFRALGRGRAHGHDIADLDLFDRRCLGRSGEGVGARKPRPGFGQHLFVVAMTRATSAISANRSGSICAAQPVTTMRLSGASRFTRRSPAAPAASLQR